MIRLLRRLRIVPPAPISREAALEIARQECGRRGWPWQEPVHVEEGLRSYVVRTNMQMRGGNCAIRISTQTGDVISSTRAAR